MAKQTTKTRDQAQDVAREAPTDNLPATTAAATARMKPPIVQFRDYVQARMATLEDALPPTIPPKRFISVLMTALQNKPSLLTCTFQSLWNACIRAAQDGLLPDGREGAIAPYGENKDGKRVAEIATWMPMIAGYRKKIFEGGQVKSWRVEVVLEHDEFDYDLAEQKIFKHHRPLGTQDPGGVVGAYSIAKLANDETVLEVMTAYQIMQVRNKSKAANGPWNDQAFFPEMCKKVVGRRHYKQLPHHEAMDAMIARDDQEHGLLDPVDTPPIAHVERRAVSARQMMDEYAGETIDHDPQTGEVQDNHDQVRGNAQTGLVDERVDTATGRTEPAKNDPISSGRIDAGQGASAKAGQDAAREAQPSAASAQKADKGGAKPAPETAEDGAASIASDTSSEATRGADRGASPGAGAAGNAAGPSQSRGDAGGSAATSTGEISLDDDEDQGEEERQDGADRPWPPGAVPADIPEYQRYHRYMLQTFHTGDAVTKFWNDDNPLRRKIGLLNSGDTEAAFKALRDATAARIKALPPKAD